MLTTLEAINYLRRFPEYKQLIIDCYLDTDIKGAADRFLNSAEFSEVLKILKGRINAAAILDLGAGNGIATYGFLISGAATVYAVEPDLNREIGCKAIQELCQGLPVRIIGGVGEYIPLKDAVVDIIYVRQVLHHTADLFRTLRECARVLKKGGKLIITREHVVDNDRQLAIFLQNHPVHKLAGGENAFPLSTYKKAIVSAGLQIENVYGPWESIINAFPTVRTTDDYANYHRVRLRIYLGILGLIFSYLPGVKYLVTKRKNRPLPGRLYSFVVTK
jgi:ubiquinone/menaquinone biosynthesis C-methylase UbiE